MYSREKEQNKASDETMAGAWHNSGIPTTNTLINGINESNTQTNSAQRMHEICEQYNRRTAAIMPLHKIALM